jgi:hypothetical protein
MVDAAVGDGLDDDREDIDADAELGGDDPGVLIVAGILAQLRHAGKRVADLDLLGFVPAPQAEGETDRR